MTMYDPDNPNHLYRRYRNTPKDQLPEYEFCRSCGALRYECLCDIKCEEHFSDEVIKRVVEWMKERIEDACREAASLGPGYRVAVKHNRSVDEGRVFHGIELTMLIPGQDPPGEGEWEIYGPWKLEEK